MQPSEINKASGVAGKNGAVRARTYLSQIGLLGAILGAVFGIGKVHAAFIGNYDLTGSSRFGWMIAYSALCWVIAYSFGLPEQVTTTTRWKSALSASAVSCFLFVGVQTAIARIVLPRFLVALSIPVVFLAIFVVSTITVRFMRLAADRERVLLVCRSADAQLVKDDIDFHAEVPCVVAAALPDSDELAASQITKFVADYQITLIVLSEDAYRSASIIEAVSHAHGSGVRVRSMLSFYNDWIGKVPVRELESTSLLFDVREIHQVGYARVSRIIDVGIALLGLIALVVATPIVLIGNLLGNKGPLLYAQDRVGRGQKPFRILKFRSMRPGSSNGEWTQQNDSRITAFGQLLRKSHLDELPQVLNILRGDLSIVGPRPEQPQYVEHLARTIPYYNSRHLVRPGLTGWAQVNYPYGADEIDAFEKLQYEFWYLQHQSLTVDLRIIARTFRHVLGFKGQ